MPTQPNQSERNVEEARMLCQCVRTEHKPRLFALKNPMYEGLNSRFERWQLLGKAVHREVLHTKHFIDGQASENILMVYDQHPPLLAQGRELGTEVATHIHYRQQASTYVGYTLDPAFHARQQGEPWFVQHFADFTHRCYEQALAHAKADSTPGLHHGPLRRQAGSQQSTTLVDFEEELKGSLYIRHVGLNLLVFMCVVAA
jgi:hypothetical protein